MILQRFYYGDLVSMCDVWLVYASIIGNMCNAVNKVDHTLYMYCIVLLIRRSRYRDVILYVAYIHSGVIFVFAHEAKQSEEKRKSKG